ncbi:MAG: alpha-amylase family glycosyl hydrolase, partial [Candidatus Gastranaerophilaceae bacterium]
MPEIKNINGLNFKNVVESSISDKNITFAGHSLVEGKKGEKYYEFYIPSGAKDVSLEIVKIKENENGKFIPDGKLDSTLIEHNNGQMKVWTVPVNDENQLIAYKFKINGKEHNDVGTKTEGNYTLAILPNRVPLSTPHQIYHLMPDSFNKPNGIEKTDKNGLLVTRKHFNKLGGNLQGITQKIEKGYFDGISRIMTTPIFGQDNVSSHGYWTTNPYQVTETMGTFEDFKNMQISLYKKGMGLIADGAFVNEGIQGVHIRDIMMYGEKSPYMNWFKLQDFSANGLRFGVLPKEIDNKKAQGNWEIKVVNSPLVYEIDKNGYPTKNNGKKNPDYKPEKPTYIQLYDKRLVNQDFINNEETTNVYPIKRLNDNNEITNYKDSVQPLVFRVSTEEVKQKFEKYKELKNQLNEMPKFRETLCDWNNFKLTSSDQDGTILLWDGNKDVLKLQFDNPDVRKYVLGVGKYWTDTVDKTLTEHTANSLFESLKGKKDSVEIKAVIDELTKSGLLPEKAMSTVDETAIQNVLKGEYDLKFPNLSEKIEDNIKEFPTEAVEFQPEVISILSDPAVKENLDVVYNLAGKFVENAINSDKNLKSQLFKEGTNDLSDDGKLIYRLLNDDIAKYIEITALSGVKPVIVEGKIKYDINKVKEGITKNINLSAPTHKETAENLIDRFKEGVTVLGYNSENKEDITKLIKTRIANLDINSIKLAKMILGRTESGLDWRIDASKDIADIDSVRSGEKTYKEAFDEVKDFWACFNKTIRQYNPKAYTIGELTNVGDLLKASSSKNPKEAGRFSEFMKKRSEDKNLGNFKNTVSSEAELIRKTGFTTQTNYSYLFSTPARFVHGASESNFGNDTNVKLSKFLDDVFSEYMKSGQIDNILYSHASPGNHDKPRAFHGFTLNISEFLKGNHYKDNQDAYNKLFSFIDPGITKSEKDFWTNKSVNEKADAVISSFNGKDWLIDPNNENTPFIKKGITDSEYKKFVSSYKQLKEKYLSDNADADNSKKMTMALKNAVYNSFEKSTEFKKLSKDQNEALKEAVENLSKGGITNDQNLAYKTREQFGTRPFEQNWEDIIKIAKETTSFDGVDLKKLEKDIHTEFLKPAISKYKAMMSILVGLPCNPTIYAGDELGMTGFESECKNVYVHNRNRLNFERTESGNDYMPEIADMKKFVFNAMSLRNDPRFKPLVNGEPVVLSTSTAKIDAVYRYNSESDVIAVFNTNGFNNLRNSTLEEDKKTFKVNLKNLTDKDISLEGAEFKAVKAGETKEQNEEYIVKDDQLCRKDGGSIEINGPAMYFY